MDRSRLLPTLIKTLVERRIEAAGKVRHVAGHADVAEKTIYNFERGVTGRTTWPDDTDEIVNAYAETLNVAPITLWREALDRWERELSAPASGDDPLPGVPGTARPRLAEPPGSPETPRQEPNTTRGGDAPGRRRRRKSA